jgi:hypothetical protein
VHPSVVAARQRLLLLFGESPFDPSAFAAATRDLAHLLRQHHPRNRRDRRFRHAADNHERDRDIGRTGLCVLVARAEEVLT